MILFSLVEGHRMRLIKLDDTDMIQRGWTGLVSRVDTDGRVFGVSAGTGPADFDTYIKVKQGTETWGTGAFLLAAGALAVAVVSMADTAALSRSFSAKLGERVDQNREAVGLGAANVVAGFVQGFPMSASSSRPSWPPASFSG